jgi:hypothetical protein
MRQAFAVAALLVLACSSSSPPDSGGTSAGGGGASGQGGVTSTGQGGVTSTGQGGATGGSGTTGGAGNAGQAGTTGQGGATGLGGATGQGGGTGGSAIVDAGRGGSAVEGGRAGGGGNATDGGGARDAGAAGVVTVGDAGPGGPGMINNDVFWKDTAGTAIYSQGGGMLKVGNVYYWYGVKYNGAVTYAATPRNENSDTSFNAVTVYSSTDLATWKFENNVLSAGASGSTLDPSWLGRLGVAYNANTKKYVLVSQYAGPAGGSELFATSDTPTGTFTFDHLQSTVTNVANGTTGDQTIFNDDDGSAYVISSSSMGRANLYVAPLHATDFLSIDPATRIFGGAGREGNAMFKANGRYYFCSSDLHGWNASHTYCISATNIMGPYSAELVMSNTDADFSHVTQTGFFVTVQGSAGSTVIFAGDRWSDFAGNGLGFNQWCPVTFNGTTPIFQSLSQWHLDVAAGTWTVGPANNYALNPSFEADRVAITQPAGWTTSTNTAGATPFSNGSGGHTGNWNWTLSSTSAYQATVEQAVTGLPAGTYTLSVWVRSSGGQSVAQVYAKNFGGAEQDHAINTAMSAWTQVTIPGIAVSTGQAQIGVTTTAAANQSLSVDDWSLVRTGP